MTFEPFNEIVFIYHFINFFSQTKCSIIESYLFNYYLHSLKVLTIQTSNNHNEVSITISID